MNIYALKGDKVVCNTLDNGYEHDRNVARKYLNIGHTYTIVKTEVHEWHTDVWLHEFPNVIFNSVFFIDAENKTEELDNQIIDNITEKSNQMKIVKITEKKPDAKLPDGYYIGKWSGNIIDINFNNKEYELETDTGVRGFNINVIVTVLNEVATFNETKN